MVETPILLITFNRPKHTALVLAEIKKQKPRNLYVFQDGPRANIPDDLAKCNEVRELINKEINWECKLNTQFETGNLGCGYGPVKAITWLFNNEEQGIILEDDCLPAIDFFRFCEEMLNIYSNDQRIWMISGMNRLEKWKPHRQSHIFTRFGTTWGWASYRRAWRYFDHNIDSWFSGNGKEKIKEIVGQNVFKVYENDFNIHCTQERKKDVWDYQWHYARLYFSGLTIVPSVNLISNIGFGKEATHTGFYGESFARLRRFDLVHPLNIQKVTIDLVYEWLIFQKFENITKLSMQKKIIMKFLKFYFGNT